MTTPERPASAKPRTLRRDAAQNRERLLRAAWEVFAELGPDAGVEEIARRAGVGMGTLYRRFPTKESLLAALSDEILEALLDTARRAVENQRESRGLEQALWDMGSVLSSRHGWLTRLWEALPADADERRAELTVLLGTLIDRAKRSGEVREDLTSTDVHLCLLSLRAVIDDTAARAPQIWRRYLSLVLAGFRPSTEPLAYPPTDGSAASAAAPPHRTV